MRLILILLGLHELLYLFLGLLNLGELRTAALLDLFLIGKLADDGDIVDSGDVNGVSHETVGALDFFVVRVLALIAGVCVGLRVAFVIREVLLNISISVVAVHFIVRLRVFALLLLRLLDVRDWLSKQCKELVALGLVSSLSASPFDVVDEREMLYRCEFFHCSNSDFL